MEKVLTKSASALLLTRLSRRTGQEVPKFSSTRRFSSIDMTKLRVRDSDRTSFHKLLSLEGKTTVITGNLYESHKKYTYCL
jgi:hypothetical protein